MSAIFKREFKAYFTLPIGGIILALFWILGGLIFYVTYGFGSTSVTSIFQIYCLILVLAVPIITMRLLSEDKRLKIDQILLTSTIKPRAIAFGKYLAAMSIFLIGIAITLVYQLVLAATISGYNEGLDSSATTGAITVDWTLFISNFLGLFLFGAALIAIGLFVSSLTESQIVSALISLGIILFLFIIYLISGFIGQYTDVPAISVLNSVLAWISVLARYFTFTTGIIDYSNIVFFLSITALFLFLTTRMLEKKRWF